MLQKFAKQNSMNSLTYFSYLQKRVFVVPVNQIFADRETIPISAATEIIQQCLDAAREGNKRVLHVELEYRPLDSICHLEISLYGTDSNAPSQVVDAFLKDLREKGIKQITSEITDCAISSSLKAARELFFK